MFYPTNRTVTRTILSRFASKQINGRDATDDFKSFSTALSFVLLGAVTFADCSARAGEKAAEGEVLRRSGHQGADRVVWLRGIIEARRPKRYES